MFSRNINLLQQCDHTHDQRGADCSSSTTQDSTNPYHLPKTPQSTTASFSYILSLPSSCICTISSISTISYSTTSSSDSFLSTAPHAVQNESGQCHKEFLQVRTPANHENDCYLIYFTDYNLIVQLTGMLFV